MHVTIRRHEGVDPARTDGPGRKASETVVPLKRLEGFRDRHLIESRERCIQFPRALREHHAGRPNSMIRSLDRRKPTWALPVWSGCIALWIMVSGSDLALAGGLVARRGGHLPRAAARYTATVPTGWAAEPDKLIPISRGN